jgi:hypothetical protein
MAGTCRSPPISTRPIPCPFELIEGLNREFGALVGELDAHFELRGIDVELAARLASVIVSEGLDKTYRINWNYTGTIYSEITRLHGCLQ